MTRPFRNVPLWTRWLFLLAVVAGLRPAPARAVGEASTRFALFVPPNAATASRPSVVAITAFQGTAADPTVVTLTDDGADGDTDDSTGPVSLLRGQTLIRYLRDGVNDDYGGKVDGDYVTVTATHPVTVMMANDSDWEHDWLPADNKTMRGTEFLFWVNPGTVSARDLDVFAYDDATDLELVRISTTALTASGTTTVDFANGTTVLHATLSAGEDLNVRHGLGIDVFTAGHTYLLKATRPVTAMFGALDALSATSQARDGGGFVPSSGGGSVGRDFVFTVPHDPGRRVEQEIRIVSFEDGNQVTLTGSAGPAGTPVELLSTTLQAYDHADVVGAAVDLYRLTSTGLTAVFEGNWLETGQSGTSDFASFMSASNGYGVGKQFLAYLGPPGTETTVAGINGSFTHLFVQAHGADAHVRLYDADTAGNLLARTVTVPAGRFTDVRVDPTVYATLNRTAQGIRPYVRVESDWPVSVLSSNFNDNVLTFAPGVLVANPLWEGAFDRASASPGELATFDAVLRNDGDADLEAPEVSVTIEPGLEFVSLEAMSLTTAASTLSGTTTTARLGLPSFVAGSAIPVRVTVRIAATAAHGTLLTARLTGSGTARGDTYQTMLSDSVRAIDPRILDVRDLGALGLGSAIEVRFTTTGACSYQLLRATSPTGPFTSIHAVAAAPAGEQSFVDTGVTAGKRYFYEVTTNDDFGHTATFGPAGALAQDLTPPPVPSLTTVPGDARVQLLVTEDAPADFNGVQLQRQTGAGNFADVVARTTLTTWNDTGLVNGTSYGYRARATDTTGNWSAWSPVVRAWPAPAASSTSSAVLAYEDMVGAGENDWDYNDWIVRQDVAETIEGGLLTWSITTYTPLARGAGYVHAFHHRQAVTGPWSALVEWTALADDPTSPTTQQVITGDGLVDLELWADTHAALPPAPGSKYANTQPGAPTVPSPMVRITLRLGRPADNPAATRDPAPFDPYLRLPWVDGLEVHRTDTGLSSHSELNLRPGPVEGDSLPFVIVVGADTAWPSEGEFAWDVFPDLADWVHAGRPPPSNTPATRWWSRTHAGTTYQERHTAHGGTP